MTTEQQYPDTWPGVMGREQQPGMTITGKLVFVNTFKNKQGQDRLSIQLETPDGNTISVPAWHIALHGLLDELGKAGQIGYGKDVTIEYEGEKPLDGGRNPLKLYKVNGRSSQVGGGGRAPSWFSGPSSEPPIQPEPVAVGVASKWQQASQQSSQTDDDEGLPF